jgi:signal transduction histidine kinase/CheY-like chemotaxis protein
MRPSDEPVEERDELAWRNDIALRLIQGFFGLFLLSAVLVWFAMHDTRARTTVTGFVVCAALILAVPALTGRPRGSARAWFVVAPALLVSIAGFASVGFLAGPGVSLTITLMLAGVLMGPRVMVGLTLATAVVLACVAWAMVTGKLPAPDPRDLAVTNPLPWARSLAVTFLGIGLFGGLMVAIVSRIERALRLAHSETVRREQAEPEQAVAHELADGILQSSQRAAELTRQLLVYSRKAQMLQTPTDLHRIVSEAVSFVRRSIDPKITVTMDLGARHSTIAADAALLQSAILNLLVNACDAMPDGGTLGVTTTSVNLPARADGLPPSGACVLLEVLDSGLGIPADLLPRVFDPFFTTKPVGKGTGLGLAAVAGTIKSHGGRIEVESELGLGTVFRAYLPCSAGDAAKAPAESSSIVRGEGEILLVDDDAMVSLAAVATLESLGYRVTRASNGKTALDLVREAPNRFRLVLLDLRMPGLSGEDTFDQLARTAPRLPILLWSGYGAEQDVVGMLRRGAAGFIQKPYRVAELSRTIAVALRPLPTPERVAVET